MFSVFNDRRSFEMNKFIVVSFYTKGTGYEREAMKLERSLIEQAIPYHVAPVMNLRSWQKNTRFKAIFIDNMMKEFFGVDIVWTDADSVFLAYPDLFDTIECDIAARFRNWQYAKNELLSGTMYLSNNEKVRQLVRQWIARNKRFPLEWEQRNLHHVVKRFVSKHNLSVFKLPVKYCYIFDEEKKITKPVIKHFQKSRQYRRTVNR